MHCIDTARYNLVVGDTDGLLAYKQGERFRVIKGPIFEVDGSDLCPEFASISLVSREILNERITEYRYDCMHASNPDLTLTLILRVADGSPVVKFKYILRGN